jgi:PKD repeat protein
MEAQRTIRQVSSVHAGGIHTVMVVDANGCSRTISAGVPVLVGLPFANFTYNITGLDVSFVNSSDAADSYFVAIW